MAVTATASDPYGLHAATARMEAAARLVTQTLNSADRSSARNVAETMHSLSPQLDELEAARLQVVAATKLMLASNPFRKAGA